MGHRDRPRIVFAGTPQFAVPTLRSLLEAGHTPIAVLTQPDRPAGRGRRVRPSPVKRLAEQAGLPVRQPPTLKEPAELKWLRSLQPDLLIVVAYGLILPADALETPRYGCWNVHASLLPRWRGAAPIPRTIEAGDRSTGVCIMQMDTGLDTGPILHRTEIPLSGEETAGELHDRLAELGARALLDCLDRLRAGKPPSPRPQARGEASYAPKLQKSEARIDWSEPAEVLERRIRAFNPWPVAWCEMAGERLRVWRASRPPGRAERPPGTVLRANGRGIDVATGDGILRLEEVQRPGKRRTPAADFLNAVELPAVLDGGP